MFMNDAMTRFRGKLSRGEPVYGTFVMSPDPAVTTIMASAGYDFITIDGEHAPLNPERALGHVRAAEAAGIVPMVRVLQNSSSLIQSYLDVGVRGVRVPHIDTAEEAREAVKAVRYGPAGLRGACPIVNATGYSAAGWEGHTKQSDENILLILSMESRKALANLEEILAVDGVEMVGFGPADIAQDHGLDMIRDRERLIELWCKTRDRVHKAGKLIAGQGGFGFEGADLLSHSVDYMFMQKMAVQTLDEMRKETEQRMVQANQ